MRIKHLALLLGLLTSGVAQAQNSKGIIRSDYHAVPGLRQHLPLDIPDAQGLDSSERRDVECIAWNIYFEVRDGKVNEKTAVAWVPLNRLNRPEFSNSICANVFQYGWAGGHRRYQFSWAGIVLGPRWKLEDQTWHDIQLLALQVYFRKLPDPGNGATYFHNAKLVPSWAPAAKKLRIGSHVFWSNN